MPLLVALIAIDNPYRYGARFLACGPPVELADTSPVGRRADDAAPLAGLGIGAKYWLPFRGWWSFQRRLPPRFLAELGA